MSIIAALGTMDIPRLRAGVGSPEGNIDVKDWVLGRFSKPQRDLWPHLEELAWNSLIKWITGCAGEGFTVRIDCADSEGKT
jgi:PTH1 family peptidyl-tRNA hydrolase